MEGTQGKLSPDLHMMMNVIRAMYKILEEDWTKQAKKHDLTSPQQHLLWILHFRDGSTISEIANFGLWHISTAMHLIDKLEEKGLVRKERLLHDKRSSRVFLTETGRAVRQKMMDNDDYRMYKLYSVMQNKRDELGFEWGKLLEFGLAVTQELHGRNYVDYLEMSGKKIEAELKQEIKSD